MFTTKVIRKFPDKRINSLIPSIFFARTFFREREKSVQNPDVQPVFYNVAKHQTKTAVYDNTGNYSFSNIFVEAKELSSKISRQLNGRIGERVLFLCPNDASYVITIWAIWLSGQIGKF